MHYCCEAHKVRAMPIHSQNCGKMVQLPSEKTLANATADEAVAALSEFGEGYPKLAAAALHRIVQYAEGANAWSEDDRLRLVSIFTAAGVDMALEWLEVQRSG